LSEVSEDGMPTQASMQVSLRSMHETKTVFVEAVDQVHTVTAAAFGLRGLELGAVVFGGDAIGRGDTFEDHGIEVACPFLHPS
jgi:hypothetical protein